MPATGGTSFSPALKDAEAFQQRAVLCLKVMLRRRGLGRCFCLSALRNGARALSFGECFMKCFTD